MSKQNKVNPTQYHVGGRLTPDDLARERVKQRNVTGAVGSAPSGHTLLPVRAEGARDKGAAGVASLMPSKPKPKARRRAAAVASPASAKPKAKPHRLTASGAKAMAAKPKPKARTRAAGRSRG